MSKNKRPPEWNRIAGFIVVFGVLPVIVFALVGTKAPVVLKIGYYTIVTAFILQATMSYLSSIAAWRKEPDPVHKGQAASARPPRTTFIVVAYLPNEVDVIEATLLNLLERVERPEAGMEVILAYNSNHLVGIEQKLKDLAVKWPELVLANAHGSRGKSENLNYSVDLASGEMVVLLDADHIVAPDCLSRAWRWLASGYDVVQGRCKIRNGDASALAALVDVEFEGIYAVSHYAKSRLFDTALFGGSDAFWKTDVIKKIRFRADMLTEDIDSTLRALESGYRIIHDRSIISRELAPETLGGLWFQRKRWAQGWFQCSLVHQRTVFTTAALSLRAKFLWTWLLAWRVIYDVAANLLLPILFAYWINRGKVELPMNGFIWFALVYTFLSGPFEAIVAYKNSVDPRLTFGRMLFYALMSFPYTMFKNMIQMIAIRDELAGQRQWIVSQRTGSGKEST